MSSNFNRIIIIIYDNSRRNIDIIIIIEAPKKVKIMFGLVCGFSGIKQ